MAEPVKKGQGNTGGSAAAVRDLPIVTSPGTDSFRTLHSILRELEGGQFRDAALLVDAMMRDDRIFSCVHTRLNGLLGTPIEFTTGDDRPVSQKALELIEGTDSAPGVFTQMITPQVAAGLLLWGRMIGIGIAEIIWPESGSGAPSLKLWHPQFLRWDWGTRSYWINHEGGQLELPNTDRNPHSDGKWIVFTPYGFQYGWLAGLVRPLSKLYLGRSWAMRDWFRHSEKHGMPVDLVYVPEEAPDAEADQLFRKISRRNAETAIKLPRASANGPSYDVKLLEASGNSWVGFKDLLGELKSAIAVCVLGQDMTTDGAGAGLSAGAVVQGGNQVRADYKRADAEALTTTFHQQLLTHWAAATLGDAGAAPRPQFNLDPPADKAAQATGLNVLAQALNTFLMAGAPIDTRALLDEYSVPMKAQLKPVAQPIAAPAAAEAPAESAPSAVELTPSAQAAIISVNEARDQLGLPALSLPDGALDPDGLLTIAEYQAKNAAVISQGAAAEQGQTAPTPAEPAPVAENATADAGPTPGVTADATVALMITKETDGWHVWSEDGKKHLGGPYPSESEAQDRLAQVERYKAQAGAARPAATSQLNRYEDRLARLARQRGAEAMAPMLKDVMAAITGASGFKDLKARLLKAYEGADPGEFEKAMKRAIIMAKLAGRHDVLKDL